MTTPMVASVQLILRLMLALILFGSALSKLRDLATFVQGVLDYEILPRGAAHAFGLLLPYVELGTAILLLSGFFPAVAASLVLLLLISFAIAIGVNANRSRPIPCHCFGAIQSSRIGWHSLLRDVILLPLAGWLLWIALDDGARPMPTTTFSPLASIVGVAVIAVLAYILMVEGLDLFASASSQSKDVR